MFVTTTEEEKVVIVNVDPELAKLPMVEVLEGGTSEDMGDVVTISTPKGAIIMDKAEPTRDAPVVGKGEEVDRDDTWFELFGLLVSTSLLSQPS